MVIIIRTLYVQSLHKLLFWLSCLQCVVHNNNQDQRLQQMTYKTMINNYMNQTLCQLQVELPLLKIRCTNIIKMQSGPR